MYFSIAHEKLSVLAAEGVDERKNSEAGFERDACSEAEGAAAGDGCAAALVAEPCLVDEGEQVGILLEQETVFDFPDGVERCVDGFFVKAAQGFEPANAEEFVAENDGAVLIGAFDSGCDDALFGEREIIIGLQRGVILCAAEFQTVVNGRVEVGVFVNDFVTDAGFGIEGETASGIEAVIQMLGMKSESVLRCADVGKGWKCS